MAYSKCATDDHHFNEEDITKTFNFLFVPKLLSLLMFFE